MSPCVYYQHVVSGLQELTIYSPHWGFRACERHRNTLRLTLTSSRRRGRRARRTCVCTPSRSRFARIAPSLSHPHILCPYYKALKNNSNIMANKTTRYQKMLGSSRLAHFLFPFVFESMFSYQILLPTLPVYLYILITRTRSAPATRSVACTNSRSFAPIRSFSSRATSCRTCSWAPSSKSTRPRAHLTSLVCAHTYSWSDETAMSILAKQSVHSKLWPSISDYFLFIFSGT